MKTLFLSPRQCQPAITGARLREYHFLRALGERTDVTYLFFQDSGSSPPSTADLPFCKEVIPIVKPRTYTAAKLLRGMAGTQPLPIINYTSSEMRNAIRQTLSKKDFDFIHVESIHMAGYQSMFDAVAPVFYDWHNIESEAMLRYSRNTSSPAKKLYSKVTANRLIRAERAILATAAGHLVCSERERKELHGQNAAAPIAVVENGVDTQYFAPPAVPEGERTRILFVGSMDYHANADAAIGFARNIWPSIHERFPSWRLTLVGSNPGPAVRTLAEIAQVEVTGTVPDVRPYYREAVASVVPLRVGGGTRLKILEAMAAGVPVVSTALGAEGLDVTPGVDILIARDDGEWLALLQSLAEPRGLGMALVEAALSLVRSRCDWGLLGARLLEIYTGWLAGFAREGMSRRC